MYGKVPGEKSRDLRGSAQSFAISIRTVTSAGAGTTFRNGRLTSERSMDLTPNLLF